MLRNEKWTTGRIWKIYKHVEIKQHALKEPMGYRKNFKIKNKKTEPWRNKTIWTDQITIKEIESVLKNLSCKKYQD